MCTHVLNNFTTLLSNCVLILYGVSSNGGELAIKWLKKSKQGVTKFLNEIVFLTSVKHKNLVTSKGCCLYSIQCLLVYKFVENQILLKFYGVWSLFNPIMKLLHVQWWKPFKLILSSYLCHINLFTFMFWSNSLIKSYVNIKIMLLIIM